MQAPKTFELILFIQRYDSSMGMRYENKPVKTVFKTDQIILTIQKGRLT